MTGCFVRLAWLLGGNVVLLCIAILIARDTQWTLTTKDAVFWCVVASVLLLRFVDFKWFDGRRLDGSPVTARDQRRWVAAFIGAWLALWIVGQSVELDA
ncbi:MAG: hypothetical protein EPO68_15735 [Planctomycetota bacterium]|nr:MAG: hypothetical protein EPO68_15735 [Planctomycetota bacterium]